MLTSRNHNAGQVHDIKIACSCRFFENLDKFKYLGTTVSNENLIHKEIKSMLNSGNGCYHSVQNLSCSGLLTKKIQIKIYKTTILPVLSCGC
jgi:hypothetical protein